MKRYKTFIVGLIFFSLNVMGQSTSLKMSTISGIVTDDKNNESIPFANVILFEKEIQIAVTQSDFDGKYIFTDISFGTYKIKASYLGQEIESKKVVLSKPKHVEDLKMSLSTNLEELVIHIHSVIDIDRCGICCYFSTDCFSCTRCMVM